MIRKFFGFLGKHKIWTIVVLVVLAGGGYWGYVKWTGNQTTVRYITAAATKGMLSTTISGTGQVSMSDQIEVKPKASGDIVSVKVVVGQEVKTGDVLVQLDATDAIKSVRDARTALESAQLSLTKLKKPATELELLQAENSLLSMRESKQQSEDALAKAYDDGFNTVANVFLDMPSIMTGLENLLYDNDLDRLYDNVDWYFNQVVGYDIDEYDRATRYRNDVNNAYKLAEKSYLKNFDDYKAASRNSGTSTIESLISETYDTTKLMAETVKNVSNFIDYVKNVVENSQSAPFPTTVSTHQNNLSSYTSKTNSHLVNLLSIKNSIVNSKSSIASANRSIAEKVASLADLKAGADALDIRSQELSVQQKQNALVDAQNTLADYTVRAPFDGVMATVDVKKGDSASAGTAIGTLITKQRIATVTLNEVDAAKIKLGQKVNLTFDAIDGLNITGEVAQVDSLGTVSQGVVSYNIKIKFDIQDDRVKSGMSVNATITTETKLDVIMVASGAVKTLGDSSYVEILKDGVLSKQTVVTGITDDVNTEIISGLNEGDEVVSQTISSSNSKKTSSSGSSSKSSSNNRNGGFIMGGPPM